ncbi:MAG: hypothetical protein KAV00_03265 [Phycisphaerae bacterium]|nr:hypothetical protein [Phycisphaerae bacterium]
MAKIFHTALVSSIHKKMHGSILRRRKGHTLLSQGQRPRDPHSERQMQLRGHFNYLAGKWGALTPTQRVMWDTHASGLEKTMSGFNDYVGMNTRLLAANYSTLVIHNTPPTTPVTPVAQENFRILKLSSTKNLITWTTPSDPALYVSLSLSAEPGLSYTGKRRWSLLETTPSHLREIEHTHSFPEDLPTHYKIIVIDPQGRLSPPSQVEPPPPGPALYITDFANDRIKEYTINPFAYLDKFGTLGTGANQFDSPSGITADTEFLYITDEVNDRVTKYRRNSFIFISEIGGLDYPRGICSDDTYFYVALFWDQKVTKHRKSDLVQVDEYIAGGGHRPVAVACDDTHLFICMDATHCIHKVAIASMSFVSTYGTQGSGVTQFSNPNGITCDDDFLYVADTFNYRIKKHQKSDWQYIMQLGTEGSGNDQFKVPLGITHDDTDLYIVDSWNARIKKHRKSDLSFQDKTGATGHGNEQFDHPRGICLISP